MTDAVSVIKMTLIFPRDNKPLQPWKKMCNKIKRSTKIGHDQEGLKSASVYLFFSK